MKRDDYGEHADAIRKELGIGPEVARREELARRPTWKIGGQKTRRIRFVNVAKIVAKRNREKCERLKKSPKIVRQENIKDGTENATMGA
jgi:hypothetical protein